MLNAKKKRLDLFVFYALIVLPVSQHTKPPTSDNRQSMSRVMESSWKSETSPMPQLYLTYILDLRADLTSVTFLTASVRSESQEEGRRFVSFVQLGASSKLDTQETSSCFTNPTMSIVTALCVCTARPPCHGATRPLGGFSKAGVRTDSTVHLVPKRRREEEPEPPVRSP